MLYVPGAGPSASTGLQLTISAMEVLYHRPDVQSIALGGGRPSLLSLDALERIVDALREAGINVTEADAQQARRGARTREVRAHLRLQPIERQHVPDEVARDGRLRGERGDRLDEVDVAFTEAVIGAGAWTVFMISALYRTGEAEGRERCRTRLRPGGILAVIGLGAMLVLVTIRMPRWGDPESPAATHVSPRYIEEAQAATATPNFVTAVLGDYRSLDTMIEAAVVFTAAMATILILGMRSGRSPPSAAWAACSSTWPRPSSPSLASSRPSATTSTRRLSSN